MIANTMEFPCVEASRCHLTEKEHGLRLSYTPGTKPGEEGKLTFTEGRCLADEWYAHLDTTNTENGQERVLQLTHCQTGQLLSASPMDKENDQLRTPQSVGTQSLPSTDSKWIMENIRSLHSIEMERNLSFSLRSLRMLGKMKIAHPNGNRKGICRPDEFRLTTGKSGETAIWELEFTSGELCFMSNPVMHNQIRCHPFGSLTLSSKFECQEVFRFIEVGNGQVVIASWSHAQTFYLTSDPDGNVFTSTNRLGYWERWYFEKTESGVYICSVAHEGRYLSIGQWEDQALHTTTQPNDYAKWHLEAAHSKIYYISSFSCSSQLVDVPYISSNRRGEPFLIKHKRDWEKWKLERTKDGYVTLFSTRHEQYLGSNSLGNVITTKKDGDWCRWEMEDSTHGGIYLKSKAYQRYLSVTKDDNASKLCTIEEQYTANETWRLEPSLPFFLSTRKIATMAATGVLGIGVTVAFPYALLGVADLGAVEIVGWAALQVLVGAGFGAGTSGVLVDDTDPSAAMPSSPEIKEDYLTASCRPISGWRNW